MLLFKQEDVHRGQPIRNGVDHGHIVHAAGRSPFRTGLGCFTLGVRVAELMDQGLQHNMSLGKRHTVWCRAMIPGKMRRHGNHAGNGCLAAVPGKVLKAGGEAAVCMGKAAVLHVAGDPAQRSYKPGFQRMSVQRGKLSRFAEHKGHFYRQLHRPAWNISLVDFLKVFVPLLRRGEELKAQHVAGVLFFGREGNSRIQQRASTPFLHKKARQLQTTAGHDAFRFECLYRIHGWYGWNSTLSHAHDRRPQQPAC